MLRDAVDERDWCCMCLCEARADLGVKLGSITDNMACVRVCSDIAYIPTTLRQIDGTTEFEWLGSFEDVYDSLVYGNLEGRPLRELFDMFVDSDGRVALQIEGCGEAVDRDALAVVTIRPPFSIPYPEDF